MTKTKRKPRSRATTPKPPSVVLTSREQAVLEGIVAGQTNVEIGSDLGIGYETVKTYVNRLRTKTGARTKTEIAVLAIRLKLVKL